MIEQILHQLVSTIGLVELGVVAAAVLGLSLAKPILSLVPDSGPPFPELVKLRIHAFRAACLLAIIAVLSSQLVLESVEKTLPVKLITLALIVYFYYLAYHVVAYFIRSKFASRREVNGELRLVDSYNSRILTLISSVLISIFALLSSVQAMDFDSLLEAGGVIGFMGVMLALTQGAWAPDVISGIIILNSKMVSEGDLLELDKGGRKMLVTVFKTKVFHTELLDVTNNHRVMIRNRGLLEFEIHNLSRFASAPGLREQLKFKIGYDVPRPRVCELFQSAFDKVKASGDCEIEWAHPLEIRAQDAGNDAVLWAVFYYTKNIKQIISVRDRLRGAIIEEAAATGIDLSTPQLLVVNNGRSAALPENGEAPDGLEPMKP